MEELVKQIMKPKEKAIELYNKFRNENLVMTSNIRSKKQALICVKEVIQQWEYIDTYIADLGGQLNPNLKFWIKVKSELEALS
jgi:hypothetical protein